MKKRFFLFLILLGSAVISGRANDPLVFVSSFTSGETGGIYAFRFDAKDGTLDLLHHAPDIRNPSFMAISPNGRNLYAFDAKQFGGEEMGKIKAYRIERQTGELLPLNEQSANGRASCYVDVAGTGKSLALANYVSGNIALVPIVEDGSLQETSSAIQHTGSSIDESRQKEAHPHSIVFSPDHRFALVADLGMDQIRIYQLDEGLKTLTSNNVQPFIALPPGSGPRHVSFHPNGKQVYVSNELANTVSTFDYASANGTLTLEQTISTLPKDFSGKSYCADVKITPDGCFLYATNRGDDSIAIFSIGDHGQLTLLTIQPSLGKAPQNLLISPDGHWLFCANMKEDGVVVFKINTKTGSLTAMPSPAHIPRPSCIRWMP